LPAAATSSSTPFEPGWFAIRASTAGRAIAPMRRARPVCCLNGHELYDRPGRTPADRQQEYRALFRAVLDENFVDGLRAATNSRALGDARFKQRKSPRLSLETTELLRREERKSDRHPYPGRRPTIALARTSIETRPLGSTGTCSRIRDLSCVTSAVAIVMSIGARLGAAIVVDQ
jgi:hypothetical protein